MEQQPQQQQQQQQVEAVAQEQQQQVAQAVEEQRQQEQPPRDAGDRPEYVNDVNRIQQPRPGPLAPDGWEAPPYPNKNINNINDP